MPPRHSSGMLHVISKVMPRFRRCTFYTYIVFFGHHDWSMDQHVPLDKSEQSLEKLISYAPDAHKEPPNIATPNQIDAEKTFGADVHMSYRMPLCGMTNLHHPTSCSRKKNCDPRWLEVRQMVHLFLDQPYGHTAVAGMIRRRWDFSNCDCTCGACHTFLSECPLGHLTTKWMSFFGTTAAFRALLVYGNVLQKSDVQKMGAVEVPIQDHPPEMQNLGFFLFYINLAGAPSKTCQRMKMRDLLGSSILSRIMAAISSS
ncbi:unnamed protein product [Amoebophrya sp. A25]|nr:unnamed protein product [Amoebophrya sp. A25]|eukprot:GSA25T00008851001.1